MSKRRWTLEAVVKAAQPYNTRTEFKRESISAYNAACLYGWLDEACAHMAAPHSLSQRGFWTAEMVAKRARKYRSRIEFYRGDMKAYGAAKRLGIMDKVCQHMRTPDGHKLDRYIYIVVSRRGKRVGEPVYVGIAFDPAKRERQHLKDISSSAHKLINEPGSELKVVLGPVTAKEAAKEEARLIGQFKAKGMIVLNRNRGGSIGSTRIIWNKSKVIAKALEFNSRSSFAAGASRAYNTAREKGYLDEACAHMKPLLRSVAFKEWRAAAGV